MSAKSHNCGSGITIFSNGLGTRLSARKNFDFLIGLFFAFDVTFSYDFFRRGSNFSGQPTFGRK